MKTVNKFALGYLLAGFLGGALAWGSDNPPVASVPGQDAITAPTPQPTQAMPPMSGAAGAPSRIVRDKNGAPLLIVEFQTDHYDIQPNFHPQLNAFGDYLKKHPESTADITGHADNSGHGPANDTLSQKRANMVVAYLVTNYAISENRMKATGAGAIMSKPDNSTIAAQQYDRRVYGTITTPKS